MGTRAPDDDGPDTPHVARARMDKACDLEELAVAAGFGAADVERDEVRDVLLAALAVKRGRRRSQVHASLKTWRLVWKLLRDRERSRPAAADPFAGVPRAGDPFAHREAQ